jgi:hypothetical protein
MASKIYKKGAYIVIVDTVTAKQQEYNSAEIQIAKSSSTLDKYEVLHVGVNILDLFLTDAQDENGAAYSEAAFDVFRFEQTGSQNSSEVANPYPAYTETIVNISSAQILSMGTTPIELLPAAGANKYYDIEKYIFEYDHNTTAYETFSPLLIYDFFGRVIINNSIIGTAENIALIVRGKFDENYDYEGDLFPMVNPTPINYRIRLTTADPLNPILGDGTLRVKIYHKTITFGA